MLEHIERAKEFDWTGLALESGFYDQAHLIHDFQDFAGMTPTAYICRRTAHRNHVPVAA